MTLLAMLMAGVLTVLAAIHLVWALGLTWPFPDEAGLTRAVYGAPGATTMPGAVSCALVSVALLFAAAWAVWLTQPHDALIAAGGWGLCLVFLLRGVAAYLPAFRRLAPEEPFATLDRRAYGPLCLTLGLGFLILTGASS